MSREWLALYTAMATKPKYRRLSPMGRGALLHVLILAGFQSPEATWDDPDELRESLILERFPPGVYDELMGLGWIELLADGPVVVHDWDAHQQAVTAEVRRTWEAARKREWRKKKKVTPSPTPLTPEKEHTTPQDKGPGHVPDMSRTEGLDEVVEEYERLFGSVTEGKLNYLKSIVGRWPAERVIKGLQYELDHGATRKDIAGRLEDGLHKADKINAAKTMRVIEDHVESAA